MSRRYTLVMVDGRGNHHLHVYGIGRHGWWRGLWTSEGPVLSLTLRKARRIKRHVRPFRGTVRGMTRILALAARDTPGTKSAAYPPPKPITSTKETQKS